MDWSILYMNCPKAQAGHANKPIHSNRSMQYSFVSQSRRPVSTCYLACKIVSRTQLSAMRIPELYSKFLESAGISTDTRKIVPGSIFFALRGDRFNANEFAADALTKGA